MRVLLVALCLLAVATSASAEGAWVHFGIRLGQNESRQSQGIEILVRVLPYVQSQDELRQILDRYKRFVPGGNEALKQFMSQDPYSVSAIPGAGGSAHEANISVDWTPQMQELQRAIDWLRTNLPATGGDAAQLWNQILTQNVDPSQAPYMVTNSQTGVVSYMTPADYWAAVSATTPVQYGGQTPVFGTSPLSYIRYGERGYDYASAGLLPPGAAPGPVTSAWQSFLNSPWMQIPSLWMRP